jgi:hypothetical protein
LPAIKIYKKLQKNCKKKLLDSKLCNNIYSVNTAIQLQAKMLVLSRSKEIFKRQVLKSDKKHTEPIQSAPIITKLKLSLFQDFLI